MASLVTYASSAVSFYLYKYSREGEREGIWLGIDAILCSGLVLLGSGLQRHFLPVDSARQTQNTQQTALNMFGAGDLSCVTSLAISMLAQFGAIQCLGIERSFAILVPLDGLIRAYRGGFMKTSSTWKGLAAAVMLLGLLSDMMSTINITGLQYLLGWAFLLLTALSSTLAISLQHESGDVSVWSGTGLLGIGVLSSLIYSPSSLSRQSVDFLVIPLAIASRSWPMTQPRAISTAVTIAWPVVVTCLLFVGFNLTSTINTWQCASYGLQYYVLSQSILTSGVASSAQSAANVIVKGRFKYLGYYVHEISKDKESRDIFYFLLLNLSFMVVQMLYGIWTNSLGLISDSIHMFFDCLALGVGLVAAVMSKWPASQSHPFGFAKVEIISGFANGIFLVLISISIMIEAIERLMEPPEMKTDQLLLISTLGLCVNLVGIFAFNHGHHHGHSHGHDHGHDHKVKTEPLPTIHTPRTNKFEGAFDHALGLRSPMPDFSDFSAFENTLRPASDRQDSVNALTDIEENNGLRIAGRGTTHNHPSPNRARSPIRRPGSPLKVALEPELDDLTEEANGHFEGLELHQTGTETPVPTHLHSHAHAHDHHHDIKKENNKTLHAHEHDHSHQHSHSRTMSYDLAAEHSHVHNDCSTHNHGHAHKRRALSSGKMCKC